MIVLLEKFVLLTYCSKTYWDFIYNVARKKLFEIVVFVCLQAI